MRGNKNILRLMKTKSFCHQQTYSKRMAKGNSLKRKEKRGNLETQWRKKTISKNIDKYNKHSFFWVF